MLRGKKIIIGVCGSIAAYKSALLTRLLIKEGAEVQVILTQAAQEFITPLTLATLSKRPALTEFHHHSDGTWNNHVELGLWADALVIAPASANTLAKMASGTCDNLLLATYLSARCPVFFAPAMDLDMHSHPATQANINKLLSYGNKLINAEDGELASGLHGVGRLAEPEHMVDVLNQHFRQNQRLSGKKVFITAGPTHEAIDPVRFIGNHSTGKMGFALAEAFASMGAEIEVVSGPGSVNSSQLPSVKVTRVKSAEEMLKASEEPFQRCDVAIFAAAVADYRPENIATEKIKKKGWSAHVDPGKEPRYSGNPGKKEEKSVFGWLCPRNE